MTTVRRENGEKVITDGPFIETKEVIGGFALVEAKDLDEAHEIAKAWPGGPVEIWPSLLGGIICIPTLTIQRPQNGQQHGVQARGGLPGFGRDEAWKSEFCSIVIGFTR